MACVGVCFVPLHVDYVCGALALSLTGVAQWVADGSGAWGITCSLALQLLSADEAPDTSAGREGELKC